MKIIQIYSRWWGASSSALSKLAYVIGTWRNTSAISLFRVFTISELAKLARHKVPGAPYHVNIERYPLG